MDNLNGIWETEDAAITFSFHSDNRTCLYFKRGKDTAIGSFHTEKSKDVAQGAHKIIFTDSPVEVAIWQVINENRMLIALTEGVKMYLNSFIPKTKIKT